MKYIAMTKVQTFNLLATATMEDTSIRLGTNSIVSVVQSGNNTTLVWYVQICKDHSLYFSNKKFWQLSNSRRQCKDNFLL